jgi:DNA gyrase/topoisomerase IV subunit B
LAEFVFSNKRVLKQYTMEDEEMVKQLLENFMGEDAAERREFVT